MSLNTAAAARHVAAYPLSDLPDVGAHLVRHFGEAFHPLLKPVHLIHETARFEIMGSPEDLARLVGYLEKAVHIPLEHVEELSLCRPFQASPQASAGVILTFA